MQVSSTTTTTELQNGSQTSQTTTAEQATLDYDSFLKLLIAQMQNQDPTDPADPAEWMGQIASFSNVEQAIQTNAKLDSLLTSMALSQVDSFIGRTVTSGDGDVSGKVAAVRIVTGGTVAILEDGTELLLGEGVEVT